MPPFHVCSDRYLLSNRTYVLAILLPFIIFSGSCATETPMYKAIYANDLPKVQDILNSGYDMEADTNAGQGSHGWTALILASEIGRDEIVRELVRRGANVNAKNKYGSSALIAASLAGHEQTVNELINAGAILDITNSRGNTPLMAASYRGHVGVVRLLLDANADINRKNHSGKTALDTVFSTGTNFSITSSRTLDGESKEQRISVSLPKHDAVARVLIAAGAEIRTLEQAIFARQLNTGNSYVSPAEYLFLKKDHSD